VAKITVITSKDRYGLILEKKFKKNPNVLLVFSGNPKATKTFRLMRIGSLSLRFLLKTLICRIKDFRFLYGRKTLNTVSELNTHLVETSTEILIMFRLGIIVPEEILIKYMVVNVHVAKLPQYGGLGSILTALDARDFSQFATAHIATKEIDSGSILLEIDYTLNPSLTYCANEQKAYAAGITVVERLVRRFTVS
jgi:methionyl-tRNA formyltransferase